MRKYAITTPASRLKRWTDFMEDVGRAHKPLDDTLKSHFKAAKIDMPAVKDLQNRMVGMTQEHKKSWLDSHATDIRETLTVNTIKMGRSLRPGLLSIVKDAGQKRMDNLHKEGYIQEKLKFNPKPIQDFIDDREDKILATVDTTIDRLSSVVATNLIYDSLDKIPEDMEERLFAQKEIINTTEACALNNMADLEAVKQSGAKLKKIWVSSHDILVRDTHTEAEDRYAKGIDLDVDFEVGDDLMQAPGEGDDPGENINCRCSLDYLESEDYEPEEEEPEPEEEQ